VNTTNNVSSVAAGIDPLLFRLLPRHLFVIIKIIVVMVFRPFIIVSQKKR
jgi:hypothetical protein